MYVCMYIYIWIYSLRLRSLYTLQQSTCRPDSFHMQAPTRSRQHGTPLLGGGGENDELVPIRVHSLNKFMHSWPQHAGRDEDALLMILQILHALIYTVNSTIIQGVWVCIPSTLGSAPYPCLSARPHKDRGSGKSAWKWREVCHVRLQILATEGPP